MRSSTHRVQFPVDEIFIFLSMFFQRQSSIEKRVSPRDAEDVFCDLTNDSRAWIDVAVDL